MDADTQEEFNRVDDELEHLNGFANQIDEDHRLTAALLKIALAELARLDPRFAFAMQTAASTLIRQRHDDAELLASNTIETPDGGSKHILEALDFHDKITAMLEPLRAQVSGLPADESDP